MQPVIRDARKIEDDGRVKLTSTLEKGSTAVWVDGGFVGLVTMHRPGKEYTVLRPGKLWRKRFGKKHLAVTWLVAMALKDGMVKPTDPPKPAARNY